MELKAGSRLRSVVDDTEVIVVRAPRGAVDLRCGGHSMVPHGSEVTARLPIVGEAAGGTAIGKRYMDAESGLELLVTKPGTAALALGDVPILAKDAKPLPSSD